MTHPRRVVTTECVRISSEGSVRRTTIRIRASSRRQWWKGGTFAAGFPRSHLEIATVRVQDLRAARRVPLRKGHSLPIIDELQNRRRELWVTGSRPLRPMRGATYLYDA